jgi:hypothetical protein
MCAVLDASQKCCDRSIFDIILYKITYRYGDYGTYNKIARNYYRDASEIARRVLAHAAMAQTWQDLGAVKPPKTRAGRLQGMSR